MTFSRFIKLASLTVACLLVAGGSFLYFWYKSGGLQQTVIGQIGKNFLSLATTPQVGADTITPVISDEMGANFVQKLFGMEEPQTFLILFLNNTELRPGGGFIGTYAVVTMDKANPEIIKVEGTEIIDNNAPKDFVSVPPAPIGKYLDLERWYFRDSNWSPDFKISAAQSLDLYVKEDGVKASDIDAVVGFTPTVIEGLLRISGPITVGGMQFTADNFTEKLEYEVEYGFVDKGVSFDDRKSMLKDLAKQVITNSMKNIFKSWSDYKILLEKMLAQKQIMMYSPNEDYQQIFEAKNWAGEMASVNYDYLLWADANLGALKTDASINRVLNYDIYANDAGRYIARAKMIYNHTGSFNWRTTRYLDYARVYAPDGSELIGATFKANAGGTAKSLKTDTGVENGKRWYGAFISVEPQNVGELTFEYYIAPTVAERIIANDYRLLVQKQLGTNDVGLTLGLEFANTLAYASPGEVANGLDDKRYDYSTTLKTDVEFEIRTK
ncbi:MAG: DUF4012 domain-containing protein [Patescibacteria group bacterium]